MKEGPVLKLQVGRHEGFPVLVAKAVAVVVVTQRLSQPHLEHCLIENVLCRLKQFGEEKRVA